MTYCEEPCKYCPIGTIEDPVERDQAVADVNKLLTEFDKRTLKATLSLDLKELERWVPIAVGARAEGREMKYTGRVVRSAGNIIWEQCKVHKVKES